MIFEEALQELRNGKKIRCPLWEKDEYLMGCYVGFLSYYDDDGKLVEDSLEDKKKRGISIVKMKGEYQHADMFQHPELSGTTIDNLFGVIMRLESEGKLPHKCINPLLHKYPNINLFLLIRDDWEIVE